MGTKYIIGYVVTQGLSGLNERDIQSLDVINIAFAQVDSNEVIWKPEGQENQFKRIRQINPDIKLMLSIGGWGAGGFSEAASTEEGREKFARSSQKMVQDYELDGIDIDWEYPGSGISGIATLKEDKENFTLLLKRAREVLDESRDKYYMLTIAVGAGEYFTRNTEMDKVATYLDYVQLMTYDMRGGFQTLTGHHTNLYEPTGDLSMASVSYAVELFQREGVPAKKLVIGAAFYSRKWEGVPNANDGYLQVGQTIGGYGPVYGDLVENYIDKNGYVRYWDDEAKAPYLFNGSTFISYDDVESIGYKIDYMIEKGLKGIMYWEHGCDTTHTLTYEMHQRVNCEPKSKKNHPQCFKYDTHVHTKETSGCAHIKGKEVVQMYKKAGYSGIVITDHYYEGFFRFLEDISWEDKIDKYLQGYKEAIKEGEKLGVTVLLGIELSFTENANDYLVYGITEEFLKTNPDLYTLGIKSFKKFIEKEDILLFQAHPCRPRMGLADPKDIHGVEVFNGNPRHNSNNDSALHFAKENNLLMSSGSDFHQPEDIGRGGIIVTEKITTSKEFVRAMKKNKIKDLIRVKN